MPAIVLARLRQDIATAADLFEQPAACVRTLQAVFEGYSDRTQRSGQAGIPQSLLASYRAPAPIIREICTGFASRLEEDPRAALDLVDALWELPILETRVLAASLLGMISSNPAQPILERVDHWSRTTHEERLVQSVLIQGLLRLRQEQPEEIIKQIHTWLAEENINIQKIGLNALHTLAREPGYANIPVFFRLLTPYMRDAPLDLRPILLDLLEMLAQRSPKETVYFLKQALDTPNITFPAWMIRQCLHAFPPEEQESLRQSLHEAAFAGKP